MKNKNTYLASALLASTLNFALSPLQAACHNLSGAYVGIGLGSNVAGNVLYSAAENGNDIFKSTDAIKGFLGGIIIGAQKEAGPLVLGAELVTAYSTAHASKKIGGRAFSADQGLSVEIGARFGLKVAYTNQLYFRLGAENTEFKHKVPVDGVATGIDTKAKKRMTGLLLGVGFEGQVTDSFMLGIEFRHTMYAEEKLKLKGTIPPIVEATDRFKPTVSAVMVRLLYKMS